MREDAVTAAGCCSRAGTAATGRRLPRSWSRLSFRIEVSKSLKRLVDSSLNVLTCGDIRLTFGAWIESGAGAPVLGAGTFFSVAFRRGRDEVGRDTFFRLRCEMSRPPGESPFVMRSPAKEPIRYARSGDVSIAYQVIGNGPFGCTTAVPSCAQVELNLPRSASKMDSSISITNENKHFRYRSEHE